MDITLLIIRYAVGQDLKERDVFRVHAFIRGSTEIDTAFVKDGRPSFEKERKAFRRVMFIDGKALQERKAIRVTLYHTPYTVLWSVVDNKTQIVMGAFRTTVNEKKGCITK
ncbi:unnamed protein product [Ectocarpus sp. 12 AP-2014]